jgi:hypothetical protein
MGLWDLIIFIVLAAIPLLFSGTALLDWHRYKRKRYLVLAGAYLLFGSGPLTGFINPENAMTSCLSGMLALFILALVHSSSRRADVSKSAPPANTETEI